MNTENLGFKPYFLFAGNDYYPEGGMHDMIASFETEEEAQKYYHENNVDNDRLRYSGTKWDWYHIVNITPWLTGIRVGPITWGDEVDF